MIYGYARVSTAAQDLSLQLAQLTAAGCQKIYREKESRMRDDRPQLTALLKALRPGDTLIVIATDRLGGGPILLLNILNAVQKSGAGFRSLAEPHIDTTGASEMAEMTFFWVGWAARWEWQRICSRTSDGRRVAMAEGVKMGRKPKLSAHQRKEALKRRDDGETHASIARSYNVNQSTITRLR